MIFWQVSRNTLWFKLLIAFLFVAVVGVVMVSFLANQATATGFRRYLDEDASQEWSGLEAALADLYARQGDWEGSQSLLTAVHPGRGQGGIALVLLDEDGRVVAGVGGGRNRPASPSEADLSLPILVDGIQVGTLLVATPGSGGGRAGEQFLTQVNQAIGWGGLTAVLLALFLGAYLARRLTRPLRQLTQATQKLAGGDLSQQVAVDSQDELGELATSFNQMAAALSMSERQRQQLLADVAHELRTPLSVMRGHLEAMLDGVFEMTPDNLAVVHEETVLLGRLVEDLRVLSLAESRQLPLELAPIDLEASVNQAVAAFQPLAEAEGVRLVANIEVKPPPVMADVDRLQQVLANLLSNALRHVQGSSKSRQVQVSLVNRKNAVQINIADNGPGLSVEAQRHIFDRFWRSDAARSRDRGGSGLGLAICQAIVTAHEGQIWVESRPGEGATFSFTLPHSSQV